MCTRVCVCVCVRAWADGSQAAARAKSQSRIDQSSLATERPTENVSPFPPIICCTPHCVPHVPRERASALRNAADGKGGRGKGQTLVVGDWSLCSRGSPTQHLCPRSTTTDTSANLYHGKARGKGAETGARCRPRPCRLPARFPDLAFISSHPQGAGQSMPDLAELHSVSSCALLRRFCVRGRHPWARPSLLCRRVQTPPHRLFHACSQSPRRSSAVSESASRSSTRTFLPLFTPLLPHVSAGSRPVLLTRQRRLWCPLHEGVYGGA